MKKLLLLLALVLSCGLASFAETFVDEIPNPTASKTYEAFTITGPQSGIEYKFDASQQSGFFQIRNSKSSYITNNTECGAIKVIQFKLNEAKKVNVYGSNEKFGSYSATPTNGILIGSASTTGVNTINVTDSYKYIYFVADGKAIVKICDIKLTWEVNGTDPVAPAAPVVTMGEKTVTVTVEEGCTAYYKFVVVNDQPAIETFALEADTWYPVENNTIDLTKLPMTSGNEKLQLTVKAVNADNVESEVYTTEPFANPGGTTGIADIELGEEAPAEYYNLQGVRMEGELTPGLYIRRQGNKATKVIVK